MGDRNAAIRIFNQGVSVALDRQYESNPSHAWTLMASACYLDPTFGQAFYQCGNNCDDIKSTYDLSYAGIACYRRALECADLGDKKASALANLSWKLHTIGHDTEALGIVLQAIELDPNLPQAWINYSQIIGTLGHTDRAVAYARRAKELDPDNTTVGMALAFALLYDRQLKEGFEQFEVRFHYKLQQFLNYPYPKWRGEDGKTVLLIADQGLGDTLTHSRFVPEVAKCSQFVHMAVQKELVRVFMEAFAHLPNVNVFPTPFAFPEADYWSTFVSLPYALGLTTYKIRRTPHIVAPIRRIPNQWKVPDRKLHIGIQWRGAKENEIDKHRSIDPRWFLELYRVPGIQLYSFQVGEFAAEMDAIGASAIVRNMSGYISDVGDTFSFLQELDMCITIESSFAHMASTCDIETWIPYSWCGRDYRLGAPQRNEIIWSPKHRVFAQREGEGQNWQRVFDEIVYALKEKVVCLDKK